MVNSEKRRGKVSLTVLSERFGKREAFLLVKCKQGLTRIGRSPQLWAHYLSNLALCARSSFSLQRALHEGQRRNESKVKVQSSATYC